MRAAGNPATGCGNRRNEIRIQGQPADHHSRREPGADYTFKLDPSSKPTATFDNDSRRLEETG